jgi:ABC-type transport system involved in cytochrome bd biosynthesis fused ATPase/permease subunit
MQNNNLIMDNHIILLLDKYKLNYLYKKFIYLSIFNALTKDLFFWVLVYISFIIEKNMDKIINYSLILLAVLAINIPIKKYTNNVKTELMKELCVANTKYFIDRLANITPSELISIDLVKYYNILDNVNDCIEKNIINKKIIIDIPFKFITLVLISIGINKTIDNNNIILIFIFIIFFAIIKIYNDKKIINESIIREENINYENTLRDYIINCKNLLINKNINKDYIYTKYDLVYNNYKKITDINNTYSFHLNFMIFFIVLIIILTCIKKLNAFNFIAYFIILSDITSIISKVNTFYINKSFYNKVGLKLNYLNNFTLCDRPQQNITINKIIISHISNDIPYISIEEPVTIYNNDHILIDGLSGSGKTSILYFLKGILPVKSFKIEPSIDIISQQCFLTLPNSKSLFSGNLYDIISNYEIDPDIEIINSAIKAASFNQYGGYISIEKLSAGELSRLLIARIIYTVKTRNYNILLFDEIDENLNEELAINICKEIRNIFNNKIILYISHNIVVKKLFEKKIIVDKGNFYADKGK